MGKDRIRRDLYCFLYWFLRGDPSHKKLLQSPMRLTHALQASRKAALNNKARHWCSQATFRFWQHPRQAQAPLGQKGPGRFVKSYVFRHGGEGAKSHQSPTRRANLSYLTCGFGGRHALLTIALALLGVLALRRVKIRIDNHIQRLPWIQ